MWVLKFLTGRKAILRLRLRNLALGAGRVKSIVALGLSGFFMNLTNSLVQVVCNATLQAYGGDLYVGVMTIINSLREVFFMPVQGLTNGAQPVTGYNYGAGRYSRVRSSIRFSVAVTVGYAAVFWAAAMLFPGLLIGSSTVSRRWWLPASPPCAFTSACLSPCPSKWRGRVCS